MKPGAGGTHSKTKKKKVVRVADPKGKPEFKPSKRALKRRAVVVAEVKDTKGTADRTRGRRESDRNVKEMRVKYLRRTGKTGGRRAVRAELEGRGHLAAALSKLADAATTDDGSLK